MTDGFAFSIAGGAIQKHDLTGWCAHAHAPGSGKSTFCEQAILQNLAIDKPIIYVTTEYDPSKAEASLRENVRAIHR